MHRYDTLVIKDFASRQQVDEQHALVDQYRAQVNTDQAQIDYAQTQVNYTTIRALIGGRVGIRQIDQGNFVHATDTAPIVVITQLQPISVVFTIAAAALENTKLTLGRVNAPVVAIGQDDRTELDHGTVELVDNQVDQSTGTIKLKARFPNEALKLWPGNFVNGRITVDNRPGGLTVPAAALRHGPRGDFVWLVKSDDTVTAHNVTAGQVADGKVLIEKGLEHGDTVVTEGYFRLENGSKVEIQKAPAKQAASTD
jgi:multidrug efflux system membrane fusion protein